MALPSVGMRLARHRMLSTAVSTRVHSFCDTSTATVQVFTGVNQPLERREIAIPKLKEGEVLVKTEMATICGSDLHTIEGTRTEPTPLVLGHEGVGTVTKSERSAINVGDRITFSIADSCFECQPCTKYDLPQKCNTLFKYGHASVDDGSGLNGCYSSHIIVRPGTHIVHVPNQLEPELVAPANCALATIANCLEESPFIPRHRNVALVQGAGLLGLYSIAWLKKVLGFESVICVDTVASRLRQASEFGAIAVNGSLNDAAARYQTIASVAPKGVDLAIEVAGSAAVFAEGIDNIRVGGTYVIAGMVHPDTVLMNTRGEDIVRKCLTIRGAHNYAPRHLDSAVKFLVDHAASLPLKELVSPVFPLDNLQDAIALAHTKQWARVAVQP